MSCLLWPSEHRPALLWCWPEALHELDGLQDFLREFAEPRIGYAGPLSDAEIWVPRLSHEVNAAAIALAPSLRLIATPSTGTDHIDLAVAGKRGIRVISLKNDREFLDQVQSTAELAWMLILACARNLRAALSMTACGQWDAMAVRGHELIGRTIGIVGYGRLGSMVGRFAHAFRMNVLATDPVTITEPFVKQVSLDELLKRANIVSIHVHLSDQTRGMIGRRELSLMRPGAVLVNTSRGGIIDEPALVEALSSGRLAAAGLDVITGERDEGIGEHRLIRYARHHDNLILTPHVGGCTFEAQAKAMWFLARRLRQAVKGELT